MTSAFSAKLLAFDLLHFVLQGQTCLLLQVFLDFLLLHSSPLWWKGHLFLVLEGLVGLHRTVWLQLLWHEWLGHRFGLPWYWRFALAMNWDHSIVFEIAPMYCILDSLVDYEGYSISSKGFLPIVVVDIMVIWVLSGYLKWNTEGKQYKNWIKCTFKKVFLGLLWWSHG